MKVDFVNNMTMQEPTPIELWEDLHGMLHLMRQRLLSRLHEKHPGLSFWDIRVVLMAGETPGITQREIVERSLVDKGQMARLLANVRFLELLERTPSDQDKRVKCLRLSAKGQRLYRELKGWRAELADEVFGDWSAQARGLVRAAAIRMRQSTSA